MPTRLSWKPINFDRWVSLGVATAGNEIAVADGMISAVNRMRLAWERLASDLDRLFLPSGRVGSHAHHDFHAPADPAERQAVLDACAVDYETALVYLEVALQLTTRLVSAAARWPYQNWKTLEKAAERGDPGIATDARDIILYLARTPLHARHKAVIHLHEHVSVGRFDNVGNLTFSRLVEKPDRTLLEELDRLMHEVRPEIKDTARVGADIPADIALTLIGAVASKVRDPGRLNYLREHLGYSLPGPCEVAPAVDAMVDAFIAALPGNSFRRMAFAAGPTGARPKPAPEEVAGPTEPHDVAVVETAFQEALDAGTAGDHQRAANEFRRVIELDPENADAHFNLAEALLSLDEPGEAIEHLQAAAAIALPMEQVRRLLMRAHFNHGAAAYTRGDMSIAAANYRRVCELDPADREARWRLAESLARDGRIDAALLEVAKLDSDKANEDDARAQLAIGLVLQTAGQVSEAKCRYERALELKPGWETATKMLHGVIPASLSSEQTTN